VIPTVLLVGFLTGFLLGWRRAMPVWIVAAVLLLGLGWGVLVTASTPGAFDALANFGENAGLGALFLFAETALLGMVNAAPVLLGGWWLGRRTTRRRGTTGSGAVGETET